MEHFQVIFKEPQGFPIVEILEVLDLFPREIIEEKNEELTKDIVEEEVQQQLQSFQKGKSQGLDVFPLEFFLGFYEHIKWDILEVVKESRKVWKVIGSINYTFITLILKNQKVEAFEDFIPISSSNVIYKVIEKVIA